MEKQSQAVLKSEPGESGKWTILAHHHRPVFLSLFLFRFYLFFSAVVDTKRTRQEWDLKAWLIGRDELGRSVEGGKAGRKRGGRSRRQEVLTQTGQSEIIGGFFSSFFFTLLQISGDFWQLYIRIFEINQIRCCVNGMKSQQVQWATNYGSRMPDRNIDMSKPELGFSYADKASRSRVLRQSASIASCHLTSLILLQQIMTQLKIYCTGSPPQTSGRTPSTTSVYSSPEYSGRPQLPSLFNWLIRADLLKDTFERVLKEFFICVQENDWDKWHGYRC